MAKKNFYAVVRGIKPGIYRKWHGFNGAKAQVIGFHDARFKGFRTLQEAKEWYSKHLYSPFSCAGEEKDEIPKIRSLKQFKSEALSQSWWTNFRRIVLIR